MKHSRLVPVILALALIAGGGLRVAGIMGKKTIGVDEGISFLSATGHEKTYHNIITEKTPPYGTPVPASEWKQFVRPDKIFCFKEISNALADYDVHPPLYFWFLHIWFLVFGASIISGTILNLLFFLLSIFALFYLARDCLKNPLEASLIALVWAMSPAVIQVSWVIRSYGLLILCVILLVRLTYLSLDSEEVQRRRDYIFLMLITAAGLLTHYSFLFPLAGAAFFLLYTLRRELRRLVTAYLFIGGGVLTAALVHPHYYRSFIFQQYQTRNSPYGSLTFRLEKVTSGFLDFIVGNRGIQKIVLVVAIIIVIWLGIAYLVKRHKEFQAARKIDFTGVSILYLLDRGINNDTISYRYQFDAADGKKVSESYLSFSGLYPHSLLPVPGESEDYAYHMFFHVPFSFRRNTGISIQKIRRGSSGELRCNPEFRANRNRYHLEGIYSEITSLHTG